MDEQLSLTEQQGIERVHETFKSEVRGSRDVDDEVKDVLPDKKGTYFQIEMFDIDTTKIKLPKKSVLLNSAILFYSKLSIAERAKYSGLAVRLILHESENQVSKSTVVYQMGFMNKVKLATENSGLMMLNIENKQYDSLLLKLKPYNNDQLKSIRVLLQYLKDIDKQYGNVQGDFSITGFQEDQDILNIQMVQKRMKGDFIVRFAYDVSLKSPILIKFHINKLLKSQ